MKRDGGKKGCSPSGGCRGQKRDGLERTAYTYIVQCSDQTLYTGWTYDMEGRMLAHNSGSGAKYTKTRRPVRLVYYESFATKREAMSREYAVKQLPRADKLKLVEENMSERQKKRCEEVNRKAAAMPHSSALQNRKSSCGKHNGIE